MNHPNIDLNGSTLMISARSPFARRVRVALLQAGIQFSEQVVDVFKPTPELKRANPLGRVPSLRTPQGEWIVDSHLILDTLYHHSALRLPALSERQVQLLARLGGLAVGLCEKVVERYLESLRPKDHQDPEVIAEFEAGREGSLAVLEEALATGFEFPSAAKPGSMCQAEIDWGCAVGYLDLRDSKDWRARFPHVAEWAAKTLAHPSFTKTAPPPAA